MEVFYIIDEHVKDARAPIFDRWTRSRALAFFWLFTLGGYPLPWKIAFQSAEGFQTTPKPELFLFDHRDM